LFKPPEVKTIKDDKINSILDCEESQRYMYAETLRDLTSDEYVKIGYMYKCIGFTMLLLRLAARTPSQSVADGPLAHEVPF